LSGLPTQTAVARLGKVIANRMSRRGMAWTIAGARRMAKVLETTHNGVLKGYVTRPSRRARFVVNSVGFCAPRPTPPSRALAARKPSVLPGRASPTNAGLGPCCAGLANRLRSRSKVNGRASERAAYYFGTDSPFIGRLTEGGEACSLMPPEISRETTGPWVKWMRRDGSSILRLGRLAPAGRSRGACQRGFRLPLRCDRELSGSIDAV